MNKERRKRISEAVGLHGEPAPEGSRLIAASGYRDKNSSGHTSHRVCGRSTGFLRLFNVKSSPHGKYTPEQERGSYGDHESESAAEKKFRLCGKARKIYHERRHT